MGKGFLSNSLLLYSQHNIYYNIKVPNYFLVFKVKKCRGSFIYPKKTIQVIKYLFLFYRVLVYSQHNIYCNIKAPNCVKFSKSKHVKRFKYFTFKTMQVTKLLLLKLYRTSLQHHLRLLLLLLIDQLILHTLTNSSFPSQQYRVTRAVSFTFSSVS